MSDDESPTVKRFLSFARVELGLAPQTLQAYRRDLRQFLQFRKKEPEAWDQITEHPRVRDDPALDATFCFALLFNFAFATVFAHLSIWKLSFLSAHAR